VLVVSLSEEESVPDVDDDDDDVRLLEVAEELLGGIALLLLGVVPGTK
jgi:hypothetical protein